MLRRFAVVVALSAAGAASRGWAVTGPEGEIRDFIAGWNAAYTRLDAEALAKLETPDFQLVDRFGHWIQSEGAEFNRQLWTLTFQQIYKARPGPARRIENIRFLSADVAVVQARAWHAETVVLDEARAFLPSGRSTLTPWSKLQTAGGCRY